MSQYSARFFSQHSRFGPVLRETKMALAVQISDEASAALPPATPATVASVTKRIANLWPAAMIALALILTLCWNVGLLLLVWWVV
jgi:hypothetical protein